MGNAVFVTESFTVGVPWEIRGKISNFGVYFAQPSPMKITFTSAPASPDTDSPKSGPSELQAGRRRLAAVAERR